MEIDSVLVDLNVIGQLKNQDKLGVLTLPGKQELIIFSGKYWFQSAYRWYNNTNRSDTIFYLHQLIRRVEKHSELFSEPSTTKTRVLRENLKKHIMAAIEGLSYLQVTYSADSNVVAQIILITEKLSECSKQIVLSSENERKKEGK